VANGVDDRKTVQQLLRGIESHCLVLAVKKPDGSLLQHPPGTYRLEANDVVTMLSHGSAGEAGKKTFQKNDNSGCPRQNRLVPQVGLYL
jgi:Trk K+ transport system NAD-binding subunit